MTHPHIVLTKVKFNTIHAICTTCGTRAKKVRTSENFITANVLIKRTVLISIFDKEKLRTNISLIKDLIINFGFN